VSWPDALPADVRYVRTTPTFTEDTVPAGLLADHQLAAGVWGVLEVLSGHLRFVFDDDPPPGDEASTDDEASTEDGEGPDTVDAGSWIGLRSGDSQVIPPGRLHHLVIDHPVAFRIEFHRIDP
jgi:tellurite resistance-related uncharacterized protein